MNTTDTTSIRKNAINLTTPNSISAASTVISGNIDDSKELADNISADGNGDISNHTSRQEWSNPRVSGHGTYRTTNEKTTVDTQQKPYRSTPEEGEGELTNTLDVHIETQNTELNAHESAADHQQGPDITETGASDGIGRDFLANTSTTSTTPDEQTETRPKEDMNTTDTTSTRKNATNLTTPNSISAANTVISGNIDDSTELIDNISADGNGDIRNHTSRQEWPNPRAYGQGTYRTTNEKATVDTQHKPVEIQTRHASNLTDKRDKNPSCGKTQATNNDNMEGNTPIVTRNAELNAHESTAGHQQAPDITET